MIIKIFNYYYSDKKNIVETEKMSIRDYLLGWKKSLFQKTP